MPTKSFAAALVLATVAALAPAASATSAGKLESHCVVHVTGQRPSGELITDEPACYATFSEAMRATGVPGAESLRPGATSAQIQAVNARALTTYVLATHYANPGFGGSSTSTVGSDCLGGWLNTSASWSNRISSTQTGLCDRVRHYDNPGLTGWSEDVVAPGGTLGSLDNATESIQYLS
jgi:hypothetical protein